MSDDGKRPDVKSLVPRGHSTTVPTSELLSVMQELAVPWAEAEKAKHLADATREKEETARLGIEAQTTRWMVVAVTLTFMGVLVIAGVAVAYGAKDVAEKLVLPLITGAGGFLAGRGYGKLKS